MNSILNVSAYKFVELAEPAAWRDRMRAEASARGLKGTVLLAEEGINFVVSGAPEGVEGFVAWLGSHHEFEGMPVKPSWSGAVPFGKLVVKVKREIIRMNQPTIRPQAQRAPAVAAATLARWLAAGRDDSGREVVMLDTRNGFEVDRGRFRQALDWRLAKFSDFPDALRAYRHELEGKTVVSYCTGGIRCEKAALLMNAAGVDNVLQLDGGILKYFEVAGGAHFEGDCFVFDEREALTDTLTPHPAL